MLPLGLITAFERTSYAVHAVSVTTFVELLAQWAIFLALFVFEKFLGAEENLLQLVGLLGLVQSHFLYFLALVEGDLTTELSKELSLGLETAVAHLFV